MLAGHREPVSVYAGALAEPAVATPLMHTTTSNAVPAVAAAISSTGGTGDGSSAAAASGGGSIGVGSGHRPMPSRSLPDRRSTPTTTAAAAQAVTAAAAGASAYQRGGRGMVSAAPTDYSDYYYAGSPGMQSAMALNHDTTGTTSAGSTAAGVTKQRSFKADATNTDTNAPADGDTEGTGGGGGGGSHRIATTVTSLSSDMGLSAVSSLLSEREVDGGGSPGRVGGQGGGSAGAGSPAAAGASRSPFKAQKQQLQQAKQGSDELLEFPSAAATTGGAAPPSAAAVMAGSIDVLDLSSSAIQQVAGMSHTPPLSTTPVTGPAATAAGGGGAVGGSMSAAMPGGAGWTPQSQQQQRRFPLAGQAVAQPTTAASAAPTAAATGTARAAGPAAAVIMPLRAFPVNRQAGSLGGSGPPVAATSQQQQHGQPMSATVPGAGARAAEAAPGGDTWLQQLRADNPRLQVHARAGDGGDDDGRGRALTSLSSMGSIGTVLTATDNEDAWTPNTHSRGTGTAAGAAGTAGGTAAGGARGGGVASLPTATGISVDEGLASATSPNTGVNSSSVVSGVSGVSGIGSFIVLPKTLQQQQQQRQPQQHDAAGHARVTSTEVDAAAAALRASLSVGAGTGSPGKPVPLASSPVPQPQSAWGAPDRSQPTAATGIGGPAARGPQHAAGSADRANAAPPASRQLQPQQTKQSPLVHPHLQRRGSGSSATGMAQAGQPQQQRLTPRHLQHQQAADAAAAAAAAEAHLRAAAMYGHHGHAGPGPASAAHAYGQYGRHWSAPQLPLQQMQMQGPAGGDPRMLMMPASVSGNGTGAGDSGGGQLEAWTDQEMDSMASRVQQQQQHQQQQVALLRHQQHQAAMMAQQQVQATAGGYLNPFPYPQSYNYSRGGNRPPWADQGPLPPQMGIYRPATAAGPAMTARQLHQQLGLGMAPPRPAPGLPLGGAVLQPASDLPMHRASTAPYVSTNHPAAGGAHAAAMQQQAQLAQRRAVADPFADLLPW